MATDEGNIIYSFPVVQAIEWDMSSGCGLKCSVPQRLRYVDRSDGQERIIGPDEVRALGETDAEFRRGIVMSDETLGSNRRSDHWRMRRLRAETGEQRLKIIASALNLDHCIQIVEAFRARGLRADYVHSRQAGQANDRVFAALENHELDAIVQSRMLGEGFDHPLLAVAMVGSIFANLGPFVQFVGRVMRSIDQIPDTRSIRALWCFTWAQTSRGAGMISEASARRIRATSRNCCLISRRLISPATSWSAHPEREAVFRPWRFWRNAALGRRIWNPSAIPTRPRCCSS